MSELGTFCRQVRQRSQDNRAAIAGLHLAGLTGQVVSVLRQELDSMVRVIYLLAITDVPYRAKLIADSVNGQPWTQKGKKSRITDREMVDLAQKLHGWTESVYRFGCAFIHLSAFHDYRHRDPLSQLGEAERAAILHHMRVYHGGPMSSSPTFQELAFFLPSVFEKVSANLECYLKDLENSRGLT
jgi:hypothetical protein